MPSWSCNSTGQSPEGQSITCACVSLRWWSPDGAATRLGIHQQNRQSPVSCCATKFLIVEQLVALVCLSCPLRWRHPDGAATRLGARQQNRQSPVFALAVQFRDDAWWSCNSPGSHHVNRQSPVSKFLCGCCDCFMYHRLGEVHFGTGTSSHDFIFGAIFIANQCKG